MNTHCGLGVQWNSLAKPDRAFAQLVAAKPAARADRRASQVPSRERDALFAESRTAVVISEQHDFRKGGFSVHYLLLLYRAHNPMEVNMKFTALAAALALPRAAP